MTPNKLLAAALWYAGTAQFAVYPAHTAVAGRCSCGNQKCPSPGKHPRCAHGHKDATKDRAQIEAWWADAPDSNVFVATGSASNIVVLDIDPKNGGDDSLADLLKVHGDLPATPQVITGSLGMHYYLRAPLGVVIGRHAGSGAIVPGVDLLGDGGGVIAPPSVHVSGRNYVWEINHRIDEALIAEMPAWLIALAAARTKPGSAGPPTPPSGPLPTKVIAGRRHAMLLTLAGILRRRGASKEEILAVLFVANANRCDPPKSESELRKIAADSEKWQPATALDGSDTPESLAARGEELLSELAVASRDDVLTIAATGNAPAALAAYKTSNLGSWLAGIDRIRPRSVAAAIEQIVRDVKPAAKSAPVQGKPDPRPVIDITVTDLARWHRETRAALGTCLKPPHEVTLYSRGEVTVAVRERRVKLVQIPGLRDLLSAHLRFVVTATDDETTRQSDRLPPDALVTAMLEAPATWPRIDALYRHPVLVPAGDGTRALLGRAYDADTGTLVACGPEADGLQATATRDEALAALAWINGEMLIDFPFAGPAERATALALMFVPFVRPLIAGCVPLHLFEAPAQGSGKGLLAWCCLYPSMGSDGFGLCTHGRDEEETRKRMTALIAEATEAVVIDNLSTTLESDALAAVLTSGVWTDRVLGRTEMVHMPSRTLFIVTANNGKLSPDLGRRVARCRLKPDREDPWRGGAWRHMDLRGWLGDRRREALTAAWTCCAAWAAAGAQVLPQPVMGSFEGWSQVMGGLLDFLGVPKFLGNLDELLRDAVEGRGEAEAFIADWAATHGTARVDTDMLLPLADRAGLTLRGGTDAGRKRSLAHALNAMRDRIQAGKRVVHYAANGHDHGRASYALVDATVSALVASD